MLIDLLYSLRPVDQVVFSPLHYFETVTGDASNPIIFASQIPPEDKAWLITNVYLQATPQAAVNAISMRWRVVNKDNPGTIIQEVAGGRFVSNGADWPAGSTAIIAQPTNILLLGQVHAARAVVTYSAGNTANSSRWGFGGFEVPRGDIQLR